MAKDPAFLFYPGDYLRDTQNLSEKSQVAYDRIMCEHMRNICEDMRNITVSKRKVDFFIKRLNDDEKEELMFVLIKKGVHYQIEWVALSISKRKAYSNSRSQNRMSKPQIDKKIISKTYDPHMENENENEIVIKKEKEELFEKAWDLYDKKQDKTKALQIWMNLTLHDINFCIEVIPEYVKSTPDKQFRKMFKTYLNNKSWENEIYNKKSKREIIGYQYDCYHCGKSYKFKESGAHRCTENDCQIEMKGKEIVGAKLDLTKTLHKK